MKFRKKPVVIEAEQWLGAESLGKVEGVREATEKEIGDNISLFTRTKPPEHGKPLEIDYTRRYFVIETLEGLHFVSVGDWVITGVKGERYPCKPDIFEATYERVDEP
jgi:hypothetical protein